MREEKGEGMIIKSQNKDLVVEHTEMISVCSADRTAGMVSRQEQV